MLLVMTGSGLTVSGMRRPVGTALGVVALLAALVGCGPSITEGLTPTIETTMSLHKSGCDSSSQPLVDHPDLVLGEGSSGCTLEARVGDPIRVRLLKVPPSEGAGWEPP